MRNEMIDMNDLTDSREVMSKQSPPAITAFILIVTGILITAFVWAYYGKIDTYVTAMGEVRTEDTATGIISTSGGKLAEIKAPDGAKVSKGDLLFSFDSDYYNEQKKTVEQQISDKKKDIENYNTLIRSIEQDENLFNEKDSPLFFHQYESYRLELQSTLNQISNNKEQINSSQNELKQSIAQANAGLKDAKNLHAEYTALYTAISEDKEYAGENQSLKNVYSGYKTSLEKAQTVYDGYVLAYDALIKQKEENPESVLQTQIEQAEYSKNAALSDVKAIKVSALNEINSALSDLERQQSTSQANIDSLKLKQEALSFDSDSAKISKEKLKNSYYINLKNSIETLNSEINVLDTKIMEIEETVTQLSLCAEQDGTLVYNQELAVGGTVSAGSVMATIVPNSKAYTVNLYIPEYSIAEISVGQKVEYQFSAISATDFGKVYGNILTISADSFAEQSTGQKFYKATASIDETSLSNKNGDVRNIQVGMLTKAHTITGSQSVLSWLLDKLNFK